MVSNKGATAKDSKVVVMVELTVQEDPMAVDKVAMEAQVEEVDTILAQEAEVVDMEVALMADMVVAEVCQCYFLPLKSQWISRVIF